MGNYVYQELLARLNSDEIMSQELSRRNFNNARNLILDKILKANPGTNLDTNDYDVFLLKQDDGSLKIRLTVKQEENIRVKYKNPDHEYLFDINDFDVNLWLDSLQLPDVITLKEEEYTNTTIDDGPLYRMSTTIANALYGAGRTSLLVRPTDNKAGAIAVFAEQEYRFGESKDRGGDGKTINLKNTESGVFISNKSTTSPNLTHGEYDLLNNEQGWKELYANFNHENLKELLPKAIKIIWFEFDEVTQRDEAELTNNDLSLTRDDLTRQL